MIAISSRRCSVYARAERSCADVIVEEIEPSQDVVETKRKNAKLIDRVNDL